MLNRNIFWKCPNCALPLVLSRTGYVCGNGHSFDRAKQGYCNFLLSNQKKSKDPGDSRVMIDARRGFLEQGYYDFLIDSIIEVMSRAIDFSQSRPFNLLDLGSGEGYYLDKFYSTLTRESKLRLSAFGIDISKVANRRAATQYKDFEFAVGSTFNLPVISETVDIALSIFSPYSAEEVLRTLKPEGFFIKVSPGPRHLYQIKEKIYKEVNLHAIPDVDNEFACLDQVQVSRELYLKSSDDIKNLMGMTPLNWHGYSDAKFDLSRLHTYSVEADFVIQVMQVAK